MATLKPKQVASFTEIRRGWLPNLCLFTLPLLLLAPLLDVNPLPISVNAGLWFVTSLLLSVSTGTALGVIYASCVVFFEHNIYGLQRIRDALVLLLSGAVVPLALLPWELGEYLELLPFASLASVPLRIYTGTGSAQSLVPMQASWAAVLWTVAHLLWCHNRERMVSHGG